MELPGTNQSGWEARVAEALLRLRGKRSREEVARASGISEDRLMRIEVGDFSALSFGEFAQICQKAYGVADPYNFPPGSSEGFPFFVRVTKETPSRAWDQGGIHWRHFLEHLEGSDIRPEFLVLPPYRKKTGQGRSSSGKHPGEELLFVISGKIRMNIRNVDDKRWRTPVELTSGELFQFKSGVEHFIENGSTAMPAKLLVVRKATDSRSTTSPQPSPLSRKRSEPAKKSPGISPGHQ